MFREMRRKNQQLSKEEAEKILKRGTSGVLALGGGEEYPYAVPISYVYQDGKIYFHSAREGQKVDAVRKWGKASFCVVDADQVMPEEYTTYYRSAIAFGRIRILTDKTEILQALQLLADRYLPGGRRFGEEELQQKYPSLSMLEMEVEHLTGKEAIELIRAEKRETEQSL